MLWAVKTTFGFVVGMLLVGNFCFLSLIVDKDMTMSVDMQAPA